MANALAAGRNWSRIHVEMAKAEIKTKENKASGHEPKMWGPSIVGFGFRTIKSPSGREVDWLEIGFSPRKAALTLYGVTGAARRDEMLAQLGKHKMGGGCLYIKRLSDIDRGVLDKMVSASVEHIRRDPSRP